MWSLAVNPLPRHTGRFPGCGHFRHRANKIECPSPPVPNASTTCERVSPTSLQRLTLTQPEWSAPTPASCSWVLAPAAERSAPEPPGEATGPPGSDALAARVRAVQRLVVQDRETETCPAALSKFGGLVRAQHLHCDPVPVRRFLHFVWRFPSCRLALSHTR